MDTPESSTPRLRKAEARDVPELRDLIEKSVRVLQAPWYSVEQMDAALGPIFGVDRQLIADGTYFLMERERQIVACGGWSRRKSEFGGDEDRSGADSLIDPEREPARIRAFFVHPDHVRIGLATQLLVACEEAIRAEGFREITMVATLAGEPFYTRNGYEVEERYEVHLANDVRLPVLRMSRREW